MKRLYRYLFGTLRGRLIVGMVVVQALMMSLLITDLTVRQRTILLDRQVEEATALSLALATSAAGWIAAADVAGMQELVEAQRRYPEIMFAMLADREGRVLADTNKAGRGLYMLDLPRVAGQTVLARSAALVDVVTPAMVGGRQVGWARVGIGQKKAGEKLAEIVRSGCFHALAAMLLGSVIAWLLGLRITRRLYAVQKTIDAVRSGNSQARSTIGGHDEAAMMAQEFNAMLDALAERDSELRASEGRYRWLLQKIQAAVVVHGADTRIQTCNPQAQQLLGQSEEQLLGRSAEDSGWHFRREDGSVMSVAEYPISRVLASGQALRDMVVGVERAAPDGAVWVLVSADPVLNERGEIGQVIVTFVDITVRKRTEETLLQSEVRLKEAQRISHLGNWELDLASNRLVWSDEIYRIFEIDPEQFSASYDAFLAAIHPDDREFVNKAYTESVAARTSYDIVHRLLMKDGRIKYVNERCETSYDEAGRPLRSVGTVHDITASKLAEEALLHLAAIVESSDDAIIGKALDGTIQSWNRGAERLYGYQADDIKGRSVALLIPADHGGEMERFLDQVKKGKSVDHYETVRLRKDGSRVDVSLTVSPIFDAAGRVVGASTIASDISSRKKAEAELRQLYAELEQRVSERTADLKQKGEELAKSQQALLNIVEDLNLKTGELEQANARLQELDRLKSLFIASMSHELRTPLNSIIGFSSVILNEWLGPVSGEQKENLAIILRCGKHLLNLINDVIDVSKIEAGKIDAATDDFDLDELIAEAVSLVKQDLDEKGLALRVEAVKQPMRTDRRRLLQCVLNLLSNAVKFTEQGSVCVEARIKTVSVDGSSATLAEICVTDTGIGISDADLPRMFQPFVRLVAPAQATTPGTGLGLYLTRKLAIEVLHGDILLESEYRKGSRFTIELPVRLS